MSKKIIAILLFVFLLIIVSAYIYFGNSANVPGVRTSIGDDYYTDGVSIYIFDSIPGTEGMGYIKVDNADARTFRVLGDKYAVDKRKVYHRGSILNDAEPATFKLLKDGYAKDKKRAFFNGSLVNDADAKSFTVLTDSYAKDRNNVYRYVLKLKGVEVNTVEIIKDAYLKDRLHVYHFEYHDKELPENVKIVKDADPESFALIGDSGYSKDKNSVFWNWSGEKIQGADPISFQSILSYYSKDKNNVYFKTNEVIGADIETFRSIGRGYFVDKNFVYSGGEIILNENPVIFENSGKKYDADDF